MSVFASQSMIRSTVLRIMTSLRFGPAFTWQCTQVRLQSLPTLTWRISGRPRRSEIDCSLSLCAKRFTAGGTVGVIPSGVEKSARQLKGKSAGSLDFARDDRLLSDLLSKLPTR